MQDDKTRAEKVQRRHYFQTKVRDHGQGTMKKDISMERERGFSRDTIIASAKNGVVVTST